MYLVAIAWLYVAVMMSAAELVHPNGGWLGALITLVLYGIAPLALVMYLMGTPMRRRARRAAEDLAALEPAAADASGTGGDTPTDIPR